VHDLRWGSGDVAAYLELHIEQGPLLERRGVPIGVVTGIAGIHRLVAEFDGRPDHAGTTPMDLRRDAACAAAEAVLAVEGLPGRDTDAVATTGRLTIVPGASNIVPGYAQVAAEMRSQDAGWLSAQHAVLERALAEAAERRGVTARLRWLTGEEPVHCEPGLMAAIERAAQLIEVDHLRLPSGAGHDAVMLAAIAPVGMVFVPSQDGRSHVPEEWTDLEHIAAGTHVLAQTLAEFDTRRGKEVPAG